MLPVRRWNDVTMREAVEAANAQDAAIGKAIKVREAAVLAEAAADSKRARAEAALDALEPVPSLTEYLRAGAHEQRRIDALEVRHDRAWDAYNAAWQAHEDAIAAYNAAWEAEKHECELHDRMEQWINLPDVMTPFPWPGEEFIKPCNQVDFDYYAVRPEAYPPGVREWRALYEAYLYEGPCTCEAEWEQCTVCAPPEEWEKARW